MDEKGDGEAGVGMVCWERLGIYFRKGVLMISVIVANHNGEKYLKDCLRSVIGQKKVKLELIVVDDGSTDGSVKLADQFKPVKLIKLKENQGPARARNVGVKQSRGRYLLFLDADSRLEKGSLQKAVKEMEKDKSLGAGQLDLADHQGHFLSWFGLPYQGAGKDGRIFGGITAGLMVRREVFEKIGGFDEDYFIYGEDTDLCWRIWLAGFKVKRLKAKARHIGKSSLDYEKLYYYGAKNSLSSIVKNADKELVMAMGVLNGLAWLGIGAAKLLTGKSRQALWIVRGWGRGVVDLNKSLKKRKKVLRVKGNQARTVMFGDLNLQQLVKKSRRWLNEG
jgi:hypothetical protein